MSNEPLNDYEYQEDDDLASRLHVVFNLGEEAWALPMAAVREIVRVPDLNRIPKTPSALLGLANLRGHVIPVYSLRRLLGLPESGRHDTNRAVVLEGKEPMAIVVDRINRVTLIEQLDTIAGQRSEQADLIRGAARQCAGFALVMVLNHESLFDTCQTHPAQTHESRLQHQDGHVRPDDQPDSDLLQFVCCRVGEQEYAIPIEQIRRISEPSTTLTRLPDCPAGVLGAMEHGEETLLVVHLAAVFNLPDYGPAERARILITDTPARGLGLLVEQVIGVLRLHPEQIRSVGQFLGAERDMAEISGLCQLQQGQRLIAILDIERLLKIHGLPASDHRIQNPGDPAHPDSAMIDDEPELIHMVVYRLGNEEFASPVSCIHEIVRMPERLQPVPTAEHQIDGLMNLRGNILPVADLRSRLGMPRSARTERQRVLVFSDQHERSGFVVDQVTEILKITPRQLDASQDINTRKNQNRVINLDNQGRMIQVLTPERLLCRQPIGEAL